MHPNTLVDICMDTTMVPKRIVHVEIVNSLVHE